MPIGSMKDLKWFCFIVTHFITNSFILYPIEKQVWNLFTSTIHLYILCTVNEFKENRQRNNIYGRTCHCTWFIIMVFCVTESYCSNKYSSIFTHLIKHFINVYFLFQVKTSDQNKHAYIKINLPNNFLVWMDWS